MLEKKHIRQIIRHQRLQLSKIEARRLSEQICHHIQGLSIYQKAQQIAIYDAYANEVNLACLLAEKQKKFYLPKIEMNGFLNFYPYSVGDALILNGLIREPITTAPPIEINNLEVIIVPMVAFDPKGYRIGSGKGYYDKTLKTNINTCTIGVAYSFQAVPDTRHEAHDIKMNYVVTENGCFASG